MSTFWNQMQTLNTPGQYQMGQNQQNRAQDLLKIFERTPVDQLNEQQLQQAAQMVARAGSAIPQRESFSQDQLAALGRSMGDANAFTSHPNAQKVWERSILSGSLTPEGFAPQIGSTPEEQRQMIQSFVQSGGTFTPSDPGNMSAPHLQPDSQYFTRNPAPAAGGMVGTAVQPGTTALNGQPGGATGSPGAAGYGAGYGLKGAEAALLGGQGMAQSTIGQGYDAAGDLVRQYGDRASAGLQPYAQQGQGASQRQAALSGALGPEAQAEAYANFQSSPGQDYLRQQAEKSLLRNSAAIGGLGGGNVRSALQEQAIGMAAQDFGNSFNRLSGVADRGFNASRLLSGIEASVGDRLSGLETERAGTLSGIQYGTGGNLANYRTRAGEQLAGQYGNTSSQLAQLQQGFGQQLADQMGQTGGNLANLLAGAGQSDAQMTQQLAALLANISTGSGSQVAGLPGIPGVNQSPGILSGITDLAGGVGGAIDWWKNRGA